MGNLSKKVKIDGNQATKNYQDHAKQGDMLRTIHAARILKFGLNITRVPIAHRYIII